jgi:hypothetical protein
MMSDGTSGDQEAVKGADFVCHGEILDDEECTAPCYLSCKAADNFITAEMQCIFGYEPEWKRIKKEATDKAAS